MHEYLSQTNIGKLFDVSSHVIGKWLVDLGLHTEEMKPSRTAIDTDLCRLASYDEHRYFNVWHARRTIAAFQKAGHEIKQ